MYRPNGAADWIRFGEGYSTLKAVTRQMINLAEVVANEGVPETSAEDGLEAVRVVEAAYQSLPHGKWLNLHSAAVNFNERKFSVLRHST